MAGIVSEGENPRNKARDRCQTDSRISRMRPANAMNPHFRLNSRLNSPRWLCKAGVYDRNFRISTAILKEVYLIPDTARLGKSLQRDLIAIIKRRINFNLSDIAKRNIALRDITQLVTMKHPRAHGILNLFAKSDSNETIAVV